MSSTQVLLSLAGQIALLLWGIHMVTAGVQRAMGNRLTSLLRIGLKDRRRAFLVGVGVTTLLQSSTATGMMASSFTASGVIGLVPALAVMLGANVGTTLIVQVVSFDISTIFPALLLVGVVAYRSGRSAAVRDAGSAVVGLGTILLSLHLLIHTMEPLQQSPVLAALLHSLTSDRLMTFLLAALLSWASHSSVAAMIFIMSLAGAGVVPPQSALVMVLGANAGSALNPFFAHLGGDPVRLRLPLGNLVNRLVGCGLAFASIGPLADLVLRIDPDPARAAANFHMAYNLASALLFIGLLPAMAAALKRLLPTPMDAPDPGAPQYLDAGALTTPSVALANAAREVLRMADVIDSMLRGSREAFHDRDLERIAATRKMDDILDRLFGSLQRYLGAIGKETLDEAEARRLSDTLSLAINLEHIGDIIDRNLMDIATKRIRSGMTLPEDAKRGIDQMHEQLIDHLQLAIAVFMSGDRQAAHRLVTEKEAFRSIERATTARHFDLMRNGRSDQIDASSLQLDITRDLKRIEAHIAATAHGVLELSGQLRPSRLQS